MDPSIEVIVLSDDDDAGGDHTGALDSSSVLIVEENEESKGAKTLSFITNKLFCNSTATVHTVIYLSIVI